MWQVIGRMGKCTVCEVDCSRSCVCGLADYCSVECQKGDWANHKLTCPPLTVAQIPGKGRGLISTRVIAAGEEILVDDPAILINCSDKKSKIAVAREILYQFNRLSKGQQSEYKKLSHVKYNDGMDPIVAIWFGNCVTLKLNRKDFEYKGLHLRFSLLNHSCSPNCIFNATDERRASVVALQRICKGEELVINYLDAYRKEEQNGEKQLSMRLSRMKTLQTNWNFTCSCEVCTLTGQSFRKNEEIKQNLINLDKKQAQFGGYQDRKINHLKLKLSLETASCDLMKKLGVEMTREIPESLMKCYYYSKCLQLLNVSLKNSPEEYRRVALDMAERLGVAHLRWCRELELIFDGFIATLTANLIKMKKSALVSRAITDHNRQDDEFEADEDWE